MIVANSAVVSVLWKIEYETELPAFLFEPPFWTNPVTSNKASLTEFKPFLF